VPFKNINQSDMNICKDVFGHLDVDFLSFSPDIEAKEIDNIGSIMSHSIQSTGTDPLMAQPPNNWGSYHEDFLDYILEELIEQPDNSVYCHSSFDAATEAGMGSSAVLPMGGSAIASSRQPGPGSDSNSNSNAMTNMTNMEYMDLVDGSTIAEGPMLPGGLEWCQ
jgi:hypothetical protein